MHFKGQMPAGLMLATILVAPYAGAVSVSDYMIVTTAPESEGDALSLSDSEIGAIGSNGNTSPPDPTADVSDVTSSSARTVSTGIFRDGDAAVTNGGNVSTYGKVTSSNSEVHALNNPLNQASVNVNAGSQGIDCSASFSECTENISNFATEFFNKEDPANKQQIQNLRGIQGGVVLSDVTDELADLYTEISALTSNSAFSSTGVTNETDLVWDFSVDGINGLTVVDIGSSGSDFNITESNLTIKGDANDTIIFKLPVDTKMIVTESNLLIDGDMGDFNVLFFADSKPGDPSFTFSASTFYGMSFWDLDPTTVNNINDLSDVQFCGQLINDKVQFSNVSGSGCEFAGVPETGGSPGIVPIPAAAPLFGSAIGLLGFLGWRKRRREAA